MGKAEGSKTSTASGRPIARATWRASSSISGSVVPVDFADELLDDLAVLVVAVGDGLGVLAPDVGEQAGEVGTGVAAALGAGQRGGERLGEVLQPAHHPAEEGGRDLTAGEQLLLAVLKARLHRRRSFHRVVSSGRH